MRKLGLYEIDVVLETGGRRCKANFRVLMSFLNGTELNTCSGLLT